MSNGLILLPSYLISAKGNRAALASILEFSTSVPCPLNKGITENQVRILCAKGIRSHVSDEYRQKQSNGSLFPS